MLVDSSKIYDCPFGERWDRDPTQIVKVNSGYCRNMCNRRDYNTHIMPSDNLVECKDNI